MSACMDCGGAECVCRMTLQLEALTEACQIFTQALGSESGYLPALGLTKTRKALDLMKRAGVQPLFYYEGLKRETGRDPLGSDDKRGL